MRRSGTARRSRCFLAADAATPARLEAEGAAVAGQPLHLRASAGWCCGRRRPGFVDAQGAVLREGQLPPPGDRQPEDRALRRGSGRGADAPGAARRAARRSSSRAKTSPRRSSSSPAATPSSASSRCRRSGATARSAQGSGWVVPEGLHAPIRQDAVLLLPGRDQPGGAGVAALPARRARRAPLIRSFGYELAAQPMIKQRRPHRRLADAAPGRA